MPLLNSATRLVTKPLPRVISPRAHAVCDYLVIGSFLAGAGWFWPRNKRAAAAAAICAAAELGLTLLTDYPSRVESIIDLSTHCEIDLGLAAMSAAMPEFMNFADEKEKTFFLAQGVLVTAVSQLTRIDTRRSYARSKKSSARAA